MNQAFEQVVQECHKKRMMPLIKEDLKGYAGIVANSSLTSTKYIQELKRGFAESIHAGASRIGFSLEEIERLLDEEIERQILVLSFERNFTGKIDAYHDLLQKGTLPPEDVLTTKQAYLLSLKQLGELAGLNPDDVMTRFETMTARVEAHFGKKKPSLLTSMSGFLSGILAAPHN